MIVGLRRVLDRARLGQPRGAVRRRRYLRHRQRVAVGVAVVGEDGDGHRRVLGRLRRVVDGLGRVVDRSHRHFHRRPGRQPRPAAHHVGEAVGAVEVRLGRVQHRAPGDQHRRAVRRRRHLRHRQRVAVGVAVVGEDGDGHRPVLGRLGRIVDSQRRVVDRQHRHFHRRPGRLPRPVAHHVGEAVGSVEVRLGRVQHRARGRRRRRAVRGRRHLGHGQGVAVGVAVVLEDGDGHRGVLGRLRRVVDGQRRVVAGRRRRRRRGRRVAAGRHPNLHRGGRRIAVAVLGLHRQLVPSGAAVEILSGTDVGDGAAAAVDGEPARVAGRQLVLHASAVRVARLDRAQGDGSRAAVAPLRQLEDVRGREELGRPAERRRGRRGPVVGHAHLEVQRLVPGRVLYVECLWNDGIGERQGGVTGWQGLGQSDVDAVARRRDVIQFDGLAVHLHGETAETRNLVAQFFVEGDEHRTVEGAVEGRRRQLHALDLRRPGVPAQVEGARDEVGPAGPDRPFVDVPGHRVAKRVAVAYERIHLVADVQGELALVLLGHLRPQLQHQLPGIGPARSRGTPAAREGVVPGVKSARLSASRSAARPRSQLVPLQEFDLFGPELGPAAREVRRRAGRRGEDSSSDGGADPLLQVVEVVPPAHPDLDLRAHVGRGQRVLASQLTHSIRRARDLRLDAVPHPDPPPSPGEASVLLEGQLRTFVVFDRAHHGDAQQRRRARDGRAALGANDLTAFLVHQVSGGGVGYRRGVLRVVDEREFLGRLSGAQIVHRPHLEEVRGAVRERGAVGQRLYGMQVDLESRGGVLRNRGPGGRIRAPRGPDAVLVTEDWRAAPVVVLIGVRFPPLQQDLLVAYSAHASFVRRGGRALLCGGRRSYRQQPGDHQSRRQAAPKSNHPACDLRQVQSPPCVWFGDRNPVAPSSSPRRSSSPGRRGRYGLGAPGEPGQLVARPRRVQLMGPDWTRAGSPGTREPPRPARSRHRAVHDRLARSRPASGEDAGGRGRLARPLCTRLYVQAFPERKTNSRPRPTAGGVPGIRRARLPSAAASAMILHWSWRSSASRRRRRSPTHPSPRPRRRRRSRASWSGFDGAAAGRPRRSSGDTGPGFGDGHGAACPSGCGARSTPATSFRRRWATCSRGSNGSSRNARRHCGPTCGGSPRTAFATSCAGRCAGTAPLRRRNRSGRPRTAHPSCSGSSTTRPGGATWRASSV